MSENVKKFLVHTGLITRRSEIIFYVIGLWPKDHSSILYKLYGIFIFITFYISYFLAIVLKMIFTTKFVEKIHLSLVTFSICTILYRMLLFFKKREQIQHLTSMITDYSFDDRTEFTSVNTKIKTYERYAYMLMYVPAFGLVLFMFAPIISNTHVLIINIWVPFNWQDSSLTFWIVCTYSVICLSCLVIAFQPSLVIWYTMLNISIRYELLGYKLTKLGNGAGDFKKDLIELVEEHRKINS